MKILKSSCEKRQFTTGSVRDSRKGKGRFDLLPFQAINDLAIHFEKGAEVYGDNNWKKGQPLSVFADSLLRHLNNVFSGKTDEPHHVSALWNLSCMIETYHMVKNGELPIELIDLPFFQKMIQTERLNESKKTTCETNDPSP